MARSKKKSKRERKWKKAEELLPRQHSISKEHGYVRVNAKYPPWFIFENIGHHKITVAGHEVRMASMRYRTFRKNLRCKTCGIKGKYFRLECQIDNFLRHTSWHFNLYGVNAQGQEILMTKDHIHPLSKGGSNSLRNLQTMCTRCNMLKSDKIEGGEEE
jgi:hypothetical protein